MKVLEVPKETPSFEATCSHCKAKLLIEKGDHFEVLDDQREGVSCCFTCAHCGHDIWVKGSEVPDDWFVKKQQPQKGGVRAS